MIGGLSFDFSSNFYFVWRERAAFATQAPDEETPSQEQPDSLDTPVTS